MQENNERLEVKDLAFRGIRRLRVFPSTNWDAAGFNGQTHYRLLAISNTYGLIFVAWPTQGLKVIPTTEIHRFLNDPPKERDTEIANFKHANVEVDRVAGSSPIVRLHCNCDGTLLAVVYDKPTPIAHIYDVKALAPEYPGRKPIAPICRIRLDDVDGSAMCDFEWNPTSPDLFCSCCTSGTAMVFSVNTNQANTFTLQGVIKRTQYELATCVSWSPKGKQLAIGFENGTVCQFKPNNLQLTKKWSPPSQQTAAALFRLVDLSWVSTNHFMLVTTGGNATGDQLLLVHLFLPKDASGGQLVYTNYDDVCLGSAGERKWAPARYLIHHVQEWAMLLCSSTISLETAVLGWMSDVKRWYLWDLEDDSRCQLPLTAQSDECFAVGADIDRTPVEPVTLMSTDGEVIKNLPPAPIFLILSTDGLICPFRMVYTSSNDALCRPAMKIQNWNDVKVGLAMGPTAITTTAPESGGSGDVSTSVTLPLFQKKQPAATVGPPAPPNATVAAGAGNLPRHPVAPILNANQSQQPEIAQAQQEAIEEREEREKNRMLRTEVIKWAIDFQKQLVDAKTRLAEPLTMPGNRDQLAEQTKKLLDIEARILELTANQDQKSRAGQLRSSICGQFIRADQMNLLMERRRSQEFKTLLRYRPLTEKQEQDREKLRRKFRDARKTVDELTGQVERLNLDNLLQPKRRNERPTSTKAEKNSLEKIYRNLANMQTIVAMRQQRVDVVRIQWTEIRSTCSDQEMLLGRSAMDDTDRLSKSLMATRINDDSTDLDISAMKKSPGSTAVRTSYKMNESLKRLLEKRQSTPRRTTVPVAVRTIAIGSTPASEPPKPVPNPPKLVSERPQSTVWEQPKPVQQPPKSTQATPPKSIVWDQPKPAQMSSKPTQATPPKSTVEAVKPAPDQNQVGLEKPKLVQDAAKSILQQPTPLLDTPKPSQKSASIQQQQPTSVVKPSTILQETPKSTSVVKPSIAVQETPKSAPQQPPKPTPAISSPTPIFAPKTVAEQMTTTVPSVPTSTSIAALPTEPPPSTTAATTKTTVATPAQEEMNGGGDMEAEPLTTANVVTPAAPAITVASGLGSMAPAPSTTSPATTSGGGIFGSGGFFSGLGGQPSPEAAKKNVFALSSGFSFGSPLGSGSTQNKTLFGGTPQTTAAASPPSFGSLAGTGTLPSFGSFGGGATTNVPQQQQPFGSGSPNMAQQGFGGFGGTPQQAVVGSPGFGSKPTFGSSNVFGGAAAFGSPGASPSGGSIFGGSASFGQNAAPAAGSSPFASLGTGGGGGGAGFAAFARTPMPTFGSLAVNAAPNVVAPATPVQQPFGGGSGFGGGNGFGGFSGFGSPSPLQTQQQQPSIFGGQQQQAPQQQQQSSFSQWR